MKYSIFIFSLLLTNMAQANDSKSVFLPQVMVNDKGVVLTVLSSGCTKKTDFSFIFTEDAGFTVKRLRRDRCRAKTRPLKLFFGFDELGLKQTVKYL